MRIDTYLPGVIGFMVVAGVAPLVRADGVSVDLGSTDIVNGLTPVVCCDGNTTPASVGGLNCRQNVTQGFDQYYYFDISDSFAFAGSRPDLYITIHYYDNGNGALTLQYDSIAGGAYKTAGNVSLASSNTWKAWSWHVTDGYFGNRQNGGADFRINRSSAAAYYLDLVYVRDFCGGPNCVRMVPQPGRFTNGQPWRDLFQNPAQWANARAKIDTIGWYDHRVNIFSDAELAAWLPLIGQWGKKFSLEVGAVKDWGPTGAACFNAEHPLWDRFQSLGGHIDQFTMDEPLTAVRAFGLGSDQYAVEQTADFMRLVRQSYPGRQIGSIEAYPYINQTSLQNWITNLNNRCAAIGIEGIDFFILDADWRNFPGNGSWSGVKALENYCRARGIPFSLVYWASPHSGSTNDCDWQPDIFTQGNAYAAVGGAPEEWDIQSWLDIPAVTVPETANCGFTKSIVDFCNTFVPQSGCSGQCPFGGTPRSIPGTIQAEDFDDGGQGVAYNDTDAGNNGGAYRSTDVDIEASSDTGGGYNVGWINGGEWLEYTVNVTNTGDHTFKMRLASCCSAGQFQLQINGTPVTGVKTVAGTGGWQNWTTILVPAVFLNAGQQVLQFSSTNGGINLNKIDVGYGGADAVHVDLDTSVLQDGMTHPQPGDGDTQGASIGGHNCRRNANSANDYYFYFAVFDSYAFQGNRPNLWISFDYYDTGTGSLTLQYDAASSPYKTGPSVTLTNSSTWKSVAWNVTDAYFGNRQNDGADFRIFRGTGQAFYIDTMQASLAQP